MSREPLGDPVRVNFQVRIIAPGHFLSTWDNGTPILCWLLEYRIDGELLSGMEGATPPPQVVGFVFGHMTEDGSKWVPTFEPSAYVAWEN